MKKILIVLALFGTLIGCAQKADFASQEVKAFSAASNLCQEFTSNNLTHVNQGRAVRGGIMNMYALAIGSGDNLGLYASYISSTVAETAPGYYKKGSCPVIADTEKPVVVITSPQDGSTLGGIVSFGANATDNVGVTKLSFLVNGTGEVLCSTTVAQSGNLYACEWDSTTKPNASIEVVAKAEDAALNEGFHAPGITLHIQNEAPVCQLFSAKNSVHLSAGRAYKTTKWFYTYYYAQGSNDYLGASGETLTHLAEISPGVFKKDGICPKEWKYVGIPGFSEGGLGQADFPMVVVNGVPHVTYMDRAHGEKVSVLKFEAGSWVYVGQPGFSPEKGSPSALVVDNGILYVGYITDSESSQGRRVRIFRFENGSWINLGTDMHSGIEYPWVERLSLAVKNGEVYVSYLTDSQNGEVEFQKFTGINWEKVGDRLAGVFTFENSLVIHNGAPLAALFSLGGENQVKMAKWEGAQWIVGNIGMEGRDTSLAVSENGTIYLASAKAGYSGGPLSVMQFNGLSWSQVGQTISQGLWNTRMIAKENTLLVGAMSMDGIKVFQLKNNAWDTLGDLVHSDRIAFSIDYFNGVPYSAVIDLRDWNNDGQEDWYHETKAVVKKYQ